MKKLLLVAFAFLCLAAVGYSQTDWNQIPPSGGSYPCQGGQCGRTDLCTDGFLANNMGTCTGGENMVTDPLVAQRLAIIQSLNGAIVLKPGGAGGLWTTDADP